MFPLLAALLVVGCSAAPRGVLVSIRDRSTQAPVPGPVITVAPVANLLV